MPILQVFSFLYIQSLSRENCIYLCQILEAIPNQDDSFEHAFLEFLHDLGRLQRTAGFKIVSFAFCSFVHNKLFLAYLVLNLIMNIEQ